MKNWIWRATSAAFAAGLAGSMACGSSSGCGGTNLNTNQAATSLSMSCGQGTYLNGTQCVPIPSSGSSSSSSNNVQSNGTGGKVISQ
jgi:hypothetical protein